MPGSWDRLAAPPPDGEPGGHLDLLPWTERYRYFGKEQMRVPGPLREVYESTASELVFMKGAQIGVSEYLVNLALWSADSGRAGRGNVLYVLPHVGDFVQARVNRAIDQSEYLRGRVRPDGNTRDPDRVGLRRIGRGHTYWRTPGSEAGLHTVDADDVIIDELDRMASTVLSMVEHRLDSSRAPQLRIVSTPTYPGRGIELLYLSGDRRRYLIACQRCGTEQPLEWAKNVVVAGDPNERSSRAYLICVQCRDWLQPAIERAWESGEGGRWEAQQPAATYPSYQLSQLYRPHVDLLRIARKLQSSNEDDVQQAWNQHLGLPRAVAGGQLSMEELRRLMTAGRVRDLAGTIGDAPEGGYKGGSAPRSSSSGSAPSIYDQIGPGVEVWGLPPQPEPERAGQALGTVMGVDPGGRTHCWITAQIDGMPTLVGAYEVARFEDVDELMERFGVELCVVDALPEQQAAQDFQDRWRGRVYLCDYRLGHWPAEWTTDRDAETGNRINDPRRRYRVQVDRTAVMDSLVARLRGDHSPAPEGGGAWPSAFGWRQRYAFPADAEGIPGFFDHMQAPVRVQRTNSAGITRAVFDEGSKPDHYFHAGVYALLAEQIAGAAPKRPPLYASR